MTCPHDFDWCMGSLTELHYGICDGCRLELAAKLTAKDAEIERLKAFAQGIRDAVAWINANDLGEPLSESHYRTFAMGVESWVDNLDDGYQGPNPF